MQNCRKFSLDKPHHSVVKFFEACRPQALVNFLTILLLLKLKKRSFSASLLDVRHATPNKNVIQFTELIHKLPHHFPVFSVNRILVHSLILCQSCFYFCYCHFCFPLFLSFDDLIISDTFRSVNYFLLFFYSGRFMYLLKERYSFSFSS